jgi:hypothetical protein
MKILDLWTVCDNNNLTMQQAQRFCDFIKLWTSEWGEMDIDYIDEWASRFRKHSEYVRADNHTRKLLVKVDGLNAINICKEQYELIGWCNESIAKEVMQICELISNDDRRRD